MRKIIPLFLLIALGIAGCSSHRLSQGRAFRLSKVSYSDLPGWTDDDLNDAYPALERACLKPQKEWNHKGNDTKLKSTTAIMLHATHVQL